METVFTIVQQLNVDSLEALLVSALVMLRRRGLARAGDVMLLEELGVDTDMAVQLSFYGQEANVSPFDGIKHIDDHGEYWLARELQSPLGYVEWRKFQTAIERAKIACKNSGHDPVDHFGGAAKMVDIGSFTQRSIFDHRLSRYACYLIAMNGDPRKREISDAQTYFAVQTRRQELSDEKGIVLADTPGEYAISPELAALKLAVATLETHERRIAALEDAERARQQEQQVAEAALLVLPEPTVKVPEKTMRADLNERVRAAARARDIPHWLLWNKLYHELKYRVHFDADVRAEHSGRSRLDLVEEAGHLPELYAIACEIL